ncbi:MAG: histidinol-phosphatase HisJ family protein, partial [Gemmatimonadetes bacterium]|nr:histidinol-phosphatase HisJ family protein [Gemmatimonadota bacterium]
MPRVNLHCHSRHSHDGRGSVEELALAARDRGIGVLCLTNHVESLLGDGETWVLDLDDARSRLGACRDEIECCRSRVPEVEVLFGAELEYRPEWRAGLEELAESLPFDFLLGSVHVVDDLQISGGPGVERAFSGRSEEEVYGRYFERVLEMVRWAGFDVVSHLDLVKRFGARWHGAFEPRRYERVLVEILDACARAGLGIEINASGLGAACAETFPGLELVRRARQAGVPFITVGTDGHAPEHVDRGLHEAERIAQAAGFGETAVFRGRRRSLLPLD